MGRVHVEIAGTPLRCSHCGADAFRHEESRLDPARVRMSSPGWLQGVVTSTYVCSGCGGVHLFAESDKFRHLRTEIAAEVDPIKCLACGTEIPAEAQRCPICGWSWAAGGAETPHGESL